MIEPTDSKPSDYRTETWTQTGRNTWLITSYHINPARIIASLGRLADHWQEQADHWQQQAHTDPLTLLPNLRALEKDDHTEKPTEEHRSDSRDTSIVFVDLDDFGLINKKYGDHNGDIALKTVASTISAFIRKEDRLYRKGGDEFVLILEGAGVYAANQTVARDLEERLMRGIDVTLAEGNIIQVRASIGVFEYSPDKTFKANIAAADTKMRIAKTQRKLEQARKHADPAP
jgi:diguanylate cyclase (GGDEF)-like protein